MSTEKLHQLLYFSLFIMICFSPPYVLALDSNQVETINKSLDEIAFQLYKPLQDSDFRQFIFENVKTARNSEKILDLANTITRSRERDRARGTNVSERSRSFDEIGTQINVISSEMSRDPNSVRGEGQRSAAALDFYLPVEAHRQKWNGDPNVLIASGPIGTDEDLFYTIAYHVETGEPRILDCRSNADPPNTPVLVVSLNEDPEALDPNEMGLWSQTDEPPEEVDGVAPDSNDTNSYIGVPWIYLRDDQEPWIRGKAEVYVLVGQLYTGSSPNTLIKHRVNLKKVNYEGKWYYLGESHSDPMYFYYNNANYHPFTCFDFWEEDGGGSKVHIGFTIAGFGFGFSILDGDDDMGMISVNRNYVPWCDYKRCDTGYVVFLVDKDP
ncbi:MAG: DUF3103 family protein [Sedimentisphaerales bacterium]|nr:DUF3103 family protein [Sedimentisphaerales bacterium]